MTGSLAVQSFDILHEYASRLHRSECPSRFASASLSRRTFMNNAGLVGKPHHVCERVILPNRLHEIYEVCVVTGN